MFVRTICVKGFGAIYKLRVRFEMAFNHSVCPAFQFALRHRFCSCIRCGIWACRSCGLIDCSKYPEWLQIGVTRYLGCWGLPKRKSWDLDIKIGRDGVHCYHQRFQACIRSPETAKHARRPRQIHRMSGRIRWIHRTDSIARRRGLLIHGTSQSCFTAIASQDVPFTFPPCTYQQAST